MNYFKLLAILLFCFLQIKSNLIHKQKIRNRNLKKNDIKLQNSLDLKSQNPDRNLKLTQKKIVLGKKKRNLFLSELTGGELLGVASGLGGFYNYEHGRTDFMKRMKGMMTDENQGRLRMLMVRKQNHNKLSMLDRSVTSIEERLEDYSRDISSKLQQYRNVLMQ